MGRRPLSRKQKAIIIFIKKLKLFSCNTNYLIFIAFKKTWAGQVSETFGCQETQTQFLRLARKIVNGKILVLDNKTHALASVKIKNLKNGEKCHLDSNFRPTDLESTVLTTSPYTTDIQKQQQPITH